MQQYQEAAQPGRRAQRKLDANLRCGGCRWSMRALVVVIGAVETTMICLQFCIGRG